MLHGRTQLQDTRADGDGVGGRGAHPGGHSINMPFGFVIVLCRLAHAAALRNGAGAFLHVLLRHARCLQVALCGVSSFLEADLSTDSVGYGVLNSAVSWSALACAPFVTGRAILV